MLFVKKILKVLKGEQHIDWNEVMKTAKTKKVKNQDKQKSSKNTVFTHTKRDFLNFPQYKKKQTNKPQQVGNLQVGAAGCRRH